MIYDIFKNAGLYRNMPQAISKALAYAAEFDRSQPDGKYEIEGDKLYAIVMSYTTKTVEELLFEAHRKYIDIQLLLDGREYLDVTYDRSLPVEMAYSSEKDAVLFKSPNHTPAASLLLEPGSFAVLYPDDIHRPCRQVQGGEKIRKMVLKVRIDA